MTRYRLLAALVLGSMGASGSAAALTIANLDRAVVVGPQGEPGVCPRSGCLQQVQMWQFGGRELVEPMPADQRELLARLLSAELSEVVSPDERQILRQVLERGDRLSAEAVGQLSVLLREKESLRAQQLVTIARAREAAAEAERQRQAARAAVEAELRRQAKLAEAEAELKRQAEAAQAVAKAKREEQPDLAAAEAERQRQAKLAEAEAERQRQAEAAQAIAEAGRRQQAELAAAEAERQRQARLAVAEAERQRQAEAAQAIAEAKREAEEAATNAARLVFYDEFPPLQPL